MEVGVSTATLFMREYNEDAVVSLSKIDARVVEIFLETFSEYKLEYAKFLKSRLNGLKVHSIHTLNTHFEPQLFAQNLRARDDAYNIFSEVVKSANLLGANYYTMHGRAKTHSKTRFDDYEGFIKSFNQMASIADKYDVKVTIENVEWAMYNKPGLFSKIKDDCPSLKTCLDIKQARLSGYDYHEYLNEMGNSLATVHISDYNSDGEIVLPGKGLFNFDNFIKELKGIGFNGNILIEVYKESFTDINEIGDSLCYIRNLIAKKG